jgi:uncharacterized protein (DUF608 family)
MKISRRTLLNAGAAAAPAFAAPLPKESAPGASMPGRPYTGESLREIAFPLGGIGTGTVSLGGYGNLRDWEIFNRPNKGGVLPFTFAALRLAGADLKAPVIRILERRPLGPYNGAFGVPRETGVGLPRLRETVFTGAYPFARVAFQDRRLPVRLALEAFNPSPRRPGPGSTALWRSP